MKPGRLGDVQSNQHSIRVREVADNHPNRLRQLANERGHREYLVICRQCGVQLEIDDLDGIASLEVFLADRAQVVDCLRRSWRLPATYRRRRQSGAVLPDVSFEGFFVAMCGSGWTRNAGHAEPGGG